MPSSPHLSMIFPNPGADSLPGPDNILRTRLDNGITLLSRANFSSPSVVLIGYLQAGGISDPENKLGLADFTASAVMRGTARRSFQQIYDALESAGASMRVDAGIHTTGFSGKALAEDLDLLLEMLAEVLIEPVFPADQVERLRAQILTGLAIRAQDTAEMASLTLDGILYPGHPYSRPEDGYPETIQAIQRADLVQFQKQNYGPQDLVISIVGGIEPQQVVEKVQRVFGSWGNPDQPGIRLLPPVTPLAIRTTRKVVIPGKSQADIVMGAVGPERASGDYHAAALGNSILGQFGMMGRIGEVVRQKAGLAYYASSSLGAGLGPGPWSISAGVDPINVERAIELIRQEVRRFVSEPVTPAELDDSQAHFIGRLPLSLESNSGIASALINLERFQLGLDYYHRYAGLVGAVTPEQILETSRRYLDPERLGVAVAGP